MDSLIIFLTLNNGAPILIPNNLASLLLEITHPSLLLKTMIGLFNNWKIFILILGLFIALGFNYEKNHNDNYKFDLEISIEDQSTLQGLVNYISQLESANFDYTVSAKAQIINVPDKLDYSAFSSDLCGFLKTAIYDHQFYEGMAYVYTKALDEYSLEMDDPEVISVTLKDMITIPTTHGICTLFKISGKLADVNFLQALLVDFLNAIPSSFLVTHMKFWYSEASPVTK